MISVEFLMNCTMVAGGTFITRCRESARLLRNDVVVNSADMTLRYGVVA